MIIDTHSHLFEDVFKADFVDCLKRADDNDVKKIMLIGYSHTSNQTAFDLANHYPNLFNSAGIHPDSMSDDLATDMAILETFVQNKQVYAIGECGLDYHYEPETKEQQKKYFEEQIKLSIKYDLPLIIHSRDAFQDTYELLAKYQGKIKGVMHCFSGSYEMALRFIELGLYIALGGVVTFKNSVNAKKIAQEIDLNFLLVETDSPYMAPVPMRGKRNESAYTRYVVEEIAKLRAENWEKIAEITTNNALSLFNI